MRYTGLYVVDGAEKSAGAYDTYEEAEAAWLDQASKVRVASWIHPDQHTMPFSDFCDLYMAVREPEALRTADSLETAIRLHLKPRFGKMTMRELENGVLDIEEWQTKLKETHKPNSRRTLRGQLSGILTAAVEFGYIAKNPVTGVSKVKDSVRQARALERWEFEDLHKSMVGSTAQLLIHLAVWSGCRFGELTELRGKDIRWIDENQDVQLEGDDQVYYIHIRRSVADVGGESSTDGGRFEIQMTTKSMHDRKVLLDRPSTILLRDHVQAHELQDEDLVFHVDMFSADLKAWMAGQTEEKSIPDDLGLTDPLPNGRQYRHGTPTGYGMGKCRCEWCTLSVTLYRRARRASGLDLKASSGGTRRGENTSGHLPRDTFRRLFMVPAVTSANIRPVRFHDLRHTHATWMAKSGMDIVRLMTRMGHQQMETTRHYITTNATPDIEEARHLAGVVAKPVTRGNRLSRR